MAMEISADKISCFKCGKPFSTRRGNFYTNYSNLYKGVGYLPYCKHCVDAMYEEYFSQCKDPKMAVRQMCRKLDIPWSEKLFDSAMKTSSPYNIMSKYLPKLSGPTYVGQSYDNTLLKEGTLWNFTLDDMSPAGQLIAKTRQDDGLTDDNEKIVPEEWESFWGSGYTYEMYEELEKRKEYYMSKLQQDGSLDIGTEVLIKQICNLEVSIARDTAAGKSIDKSVNALNTVIGSLNLKPTQKKNEDMEEKYITTPLGVWLYRYENERPLPETPEELKDVNHIKKYIFTWMGHLCKMLGIKNGYTKLYEKEIERLRVEKPEYEDDDEEDLLIDSYSEPDGGDI